MNVSCSIDFAQWTEIKQPDCFQIEGRLPRSPIPQYAEALRIVGGGTLYVPPLHNPEQGYLVQLQGQAMSWQRSHGLGEQNVVERIATRARGVARVDFALDIHGPEESFTDVTRKVLAGQYECKAKKQPKAYVTPDGAEGFQLGSPSSERFLTVYDKAREMNILSEALHRVELKQRRERARAAIIDARNYGVPTATISHILDFASFPTWDEFNRATVTQTIEPRKFSRLDSNYEAWLNQVYKSLSNAADHPDKRQAASDFIEHVLLSARKDVDENGVVRWRVGT